MEVHGRYIFPSILAVVVVLFCHSGVHGTWYMMVHGIGTFLPAILFVQMVEHGSGGML